MINSVTLVGYLGNDPVLKKLGTGTAKSEFRVACNEVYLNNGKKVERTHWFTCEAFGKTAEICKKFLKKGSRIGIHGPLQYRTWEDGNGIKRSSIRIFIKEIEFLDAKQAKESITIPDL